MTAQGPPFYFLEESSVVPWVKVTKPVITSIRITAQDSTGKPIPHALNGILDPVSGITPTYTDYLTLTLIFRQIQSSVGKQIN